MWRRIIVIFIGACVASVLSLSIYSTLCYWRLCSAITSAKVLQYGPTESWQMFPESWANIDGGVSLPVLLYAKHRFPSLENPHALAHFVVEHFWTLLVAATACSIVAILGTTIGGVGIASRRWRMHAPRGGGLSASEVRSLALSAISVAWIALASLPVIAAAIWYVVADRHLSSVMSLNAVPEGSFSYWLAGLLLVFSAIWLGCTAGKAWMAAHARQEAKCFRCGYRRGETGSFVCPECGTDSATTSSLIQTKIFRSFHAVAALFGSGILIGVLCLPPSGRVGAWIRLRLPVPSDACRDPAITFQPGESLWLRWPDMQAIVQVTRWWSPSRVGNLTLGHTRVVVASWGLEQWDIDPAQATIQVQDYDDPSDNLWTIPVSIGMRKAALRVQLEEYAQVTITVPGAQEFFRHGSPSGISLMGIRVAELAGKRPEIPPSEETKP